MTNEINKTLSAAILRLLRPLVRILLRNGVSYGAFSDLARWVFVDVADKEFGIPGRKQTVSRISVVTGLNRKEVKRLQQTSAADDSTVNRRYNRAARVIGGWNRDERFCDNEGSPLLLSFEGESPNFSDLVKQYSGDMPPRAVLDELRRIGAVEESADGRLQLMVKAYVPLGDEMAKLNILGTDVYHLINTIDHNLRSSGEAPRFQRKVAYDNLPEEVIPQLRRLSGEKSQALLEELDRWLRQQDRDANPKVEGTGRKRAGIGIYYFEEDVQEKSRDEE
ncbi:MAG: DUF6502 family protein [Pseudomonadota bacterium]